MSSSALTLGRANGAVLLGQALKLTVPVQMETGEGASAMCFEADVFYGDSRQDASRVSVSSELLPQSQSANVTVTAQAGVDEPVVTVYLRAGCESKTIRRYVMLAESAASVVPSPIISDLPLVSPTPRTVSVIQPASPDKAMPTVPTADRRAKAATVDAKPGRAADVKPAPKSPKLEGRRARLKLAPLDLAPERDPTLKLSDELFVEQGEDPQKRARAAALWRSLNATPQEIWSAESRRSALDSDLRGLHDITVKNRQVLEELTRRLDRAESERYSNPLVFGLFAAIVLCGLAIALVWNRAPWRGMAGVPWWRGDTTGDRAETVEFGEGDIPAPRNAGTQNAKKMDARSTAAIDGMVAAPAQGGTQMDIDLYLDDAGENNPSASFDAKPPQPDATPSKPVLRASGHMDFAHSMSATLRSVNTKEMLDVRQQAEFFMTLGQHEEAVALLQESVDASADANPLVSLELLKVLHTLGRKVEYDHYRSGFNAIFNGHVPAYADFNRPGSGLEAYPEVCGRIVALWPEEDAISYIENSLVRTHREAGGQNFDLEAFRDLLLLHGVASRIASLSFDSGFMAFSAAKTAPTPIEPAGAASDVVVDFDLSEPRGGNLVDVDGRGWSPSAPSDDKSKPS
nr:hypothetical protein [Rhodoferax sp.]